MTPESRANMTLPISLDGAVTHRGTDTPPRCIQTLPGSTDGPGAFYIQRVLTTDYTHGTSTSGNEDSRMAYVGVCRRLVHHRSVLDVADCDFKIRLPF